MSKEVKAVEKAPITVNNYNRYCEDGAVKNVVISFNENVAKYNKYGHYKVGDSYMPTGNPNDPFSNVGDRELARDAVDSDITYKIHGEIDYEEVDYSYEDYEDLTASEIGRYEIKAKIEALKVGNEIQEKIGYGKYNLRNGKNLAAFLKFAYGFYSNSGEYRVGKETAEDLKGTVVEGLNICPMEEMKIFKDINTASVELGITFNNNFKECTNNWQYVGNKEIYNSDRVFEKLQDIYVGLVYLYPALKELQGKGNMNLDELDDNDRGAIFSMVYEIKGQMPISPNGVSVDNLVKKFSRIGMGDMIGALIEDGLDFSVAERIYRYMIEIKYKNNDLKLARWISEYEDIIGRDYEPLNEEEYKKFLKAYNEAYAKYGSDISKETAFDYINYGQVENPEHFESKISLKKAINNLSIHLETYFKDSQFMKGNKNYVAKSYMMAKKISENESFIELTDIYASDVKVIEYSKGYVSDEVLLSDTQIVKLDFPPNPEDDYDTDGDGINDTIELGVLELVDISKYIEAYIEYNRIDEEEANKLRQNPLIPMYNYISNPVLPDSDFDGRGDNIDNKKLDNEYDSINETSNYNDIKIKYNNDYRYFFMDSSKYYYEVAKMGLVLSNMICNKVNKKGEILNKKWENVKEGEKIKCDVEDFLIYMGINNVKNKTKENVPYIIGQHDIEMGDKNKKRNLIIVAIGEDENYKDILAANYDGVLGNNEGQNIHHVGYEDEAEKIYKELLEYKNNNQNWRWKNVYWIVGYGTGGAVANLVAKKFIDNEKTREDIYCYTYQAPNTINMSNMSVYKKVPNEKYRNIFNIENLDDITLSLVGSKIGFEKYGVKKVLNYSKTTDVYNTLKKIPLFKTDDMKINDKMEEIEEYYNENRIIRNSMNNYTDAYLGVYRLMKLEKIKEVDKEKADKIEKKVKSENENYGDFDTLNDIAINICRNHKKLYKDAKDVKQINQIIDKELIDIYRQTYVNRVLSKDINRLINSIIKVGTWYTRAIATYQGILETELIYNTELDRKYVLKTNLADKLGERELNIYTDCEYPNSEIILYAQDEGIHAELTFVKNNIGKNPNLKYENLEDWHKTQVLKASDEQILNYKMFNYENNSITRSELYCYPCEFLDHENKHYSKAADDCVRFAWTVLTDFDSEFPEKFEKYSGMDLFYIKCSRLCGFTKKEGLQHDIKARVKTEYGMYMAGFDIYDCDFKELQVVDANKYDPGGEKDRKYVIYPVTDDFELQPGDFIISPKHCSFYLGKNDDGKCDVFGWGTVRKEFPQKTILKRNDQENGDNRFSRDNHKIYRYVDFR